MSKSQRILPRLLLIACGSFSPPTMMHLRMFEIARNQLQERGLYDVIGGIMSPVHDDQQKDGLIEGVHRLAMLKLSLGSSNWIRVSDWELQQPQWTPTVDVLKHHSKCVNDALITNVEDEQTAVLPDWLPLRLLESADEVELKFLIGGDLLETFADPKQWTNDEIENILCNYGLVVLTRLGSNPEKFIFESDILSKYRHNIHIVMNWTEHNLSSTLVRRLLNRGQSAKYLLHDDVVEYIEGNKLYKKT